MPREDSLRFAVFAVFKEIETLFDIQG